MLTSPCSMSAAREAGRDAVARAWLAYEPPFKRTVLRASDLPARDGWDAITVVNYETSPTEHVVVQG